MFNRTASKRSGRPPILRGSAMAKECQIRTDAQPDDSRPAVFMSREEIEQLVENDPLLVPSGVSAFQVDAAVLDPQELEALLSGLHQQLLQVADAPGSAGQTGSEQTSFDQTGDELAAA